MDAERFVPLFEPGYYARGVHRSRSIDTGVWPALRYVVTAVPIAPDECGAKLSFTWEESECPAGPFTVAKDVSVLGGWQNGERGASAFNLLLGERFGRKRFMRLAVLLAGSPIARVAVLAELFGSIEQLEAVLDMRGATLQPPARPGTVYGTTDEGARDGQ